MQGEVRMRTWVVGVALALCAATAVAGDAEEDLFEGRELLGGPEHERGVALLRGVIASGEVAPKDAFKQQLAGRAHYFLDEEAQAVAAFERALALEPKVARHAFWLGRAAIDVDTAKAVKAFGDAVALDAADADNWYGLGRARATAKDLAGAVEAFEKTLAISPEYSGARYYAAQALQGLGRTEEALSLLRGEVKRDPTEVDAGTLLGHLEYEAGRHEKALEAYLAVEPHAGPGVDVRSRIVMALFALERYEDAEPWRKKVRALHAASKSPRQRARKEFCIDEFRVDGAEVVVYEQFDQSAEALVWYAFRVRRDGKPVMQVNLEPGPVAPGLGILGGNFLLGAYDDVGHTTFDKEWQTEPTYPELKQAVVAAIRGELGWRSRSNRKQPAGDGPK
jgi:tetratricopeptide (TPR) repeat protein